MSFAISSLSPTHRLDSWLCTPMKAFHPLLGLLKVLGKLCGREKVQWWSIGANEASDHVWVLVISPTPHPLKSTGNSVFECTDSRKGLRNMSAFQDTFPGAAGCRFCLCWCAVPEPGRCAALPAGGHCPFRREWGGRQWSQTPGRVTQVHTHTAHGGEREQELKKILVWTQITGHFTSWRKASALEAYSMYNAQRFQVPAQSRGPPRSRELCTEFTGKVYRRVYYIPRPSVPCGVLVCVQKTETGLCVLRIPGTAHGTNVSKCWHVPLASLWDTRLHLD